jgi:hypothetical protein
MCGSNFKEGFSKHIELPDDSPAYVDLLLTCMYKLDYDDDACFVDNQESMTLPLLVNAEVHALADKYSVSFVQEVSALKTSRLAEQWLQKGYLSANMECFVHAAELVWQSNASIPHRRFYLDIIKNSTNGKAVLHSQHLLDLICRDGDFAVELHKTLYMAPNPVIAFCFSCRTTYIVDEVMKGAIWECCEREPKFQRAKRITRTTNLPK